MTLCIGDDVVVVVPQAVGASYQMDGAGLLSLPAVALILPSRSR